MSYEPRKVGTVKVGRYIIDPDSNEPCKVISIDKSKPGKHGAAKARIMILGLFDNQKRQLISPVDKRINVPIIEKRKGQVTDVESGTDFIHVMDNESFETFVVKPPTDEDLKTKLNDLFQSGKGVEIDYWIVMDKKIITLVREMES
ncbi:MAG: translation initiation factor IF-5A [Candidatus Heimdallarchaeota archaeon]|nr:translation initiation factor IF-5A [Candidatus Heimdallarchaeota archaeon]